MTRPEMDRRSFLAAAGSAAATASLAGCTGGGDTDSGTTTADVPDEFEVTITQGQMPTSLDPHNHRSTPTDNVLLHAYEGVLGRDRTGKIVDELATSYERVEDGLVRFQLRDGVTFHNGDELTPGDVAFSINRVVDPETSIKSPQSDQLSGVTGASVVDGERAVEVSSDGFNPIVFSLFATNLDVVQKSWVEAREKSEVAQEINGTGPFALDSYEQEVEVVFSRNEEYWGDLADVSQLTFRAATEASTRVNQLLEGETDVIVNVPPQEIGRVRDSDAARVAAVPSTRVLFNAMRHDLEPFSNAAFRRAMNHAIDLESIIANVLQSFGDQTGQPTLEGFFGYNPDVELYPHDPDRAEQLVEESGFAGAELTLHTPVGRYLKDVEIAQAVAEQIDGLSNVSCSVKQRDFGTLAGELTDGNIETSPPFYLIGWGNATFDASQTLIPLLTTDGAVTSYGNEEVDSLVSDAQSEPDQDTRESLLQEANQRLHDQAPWIFLNRQYSVYGASSRIDWQARRDERIDAYAMSPK